MNSYDLRSSLSAAISKSEFAARVARVARPHIFERIKAALNPQGCLERRMRMIREFSLIERVVNASNAGDLATARQWCNAILSDRLDYDAAVLPIDALDAVFLPAYALLKLKEGDHEGALTLLARSLDKLTEHHWAGVPDANIAFLEQRLNSIRILALAGDPARLEEVVIAFNQLLAIDSDGGSGLTALRGHDADAPVLLEYFFAHAMGKAVERLDREALTRVMKDLAQVAANRKDADPLVHSASIYARVAIQSDPFADIGVVDTDLLVMAPPLMLMMIERETRSHLDGAEDNLQQTIEGHPHYKRYNASSYTARHEVLPMAA